MDCFPLASPQVPLIPSFEQLYAASLPFLRQSLRWLGVEKHDLDDVLQEVMLATYRALPRFDPSRGLITDDSRSDMEPKQLMEAQQAPAGSVLNAPLKRWLFGIAWRQASHYRERAYRRREVVVGAGSSWPVPTPDDGLNSEQLLANEQRAELVSVLLDRLEQNRKTVLIMYDLLEIPVDEIAHELQWSEGTVRTRLRLARQDFRTAVKRLSAEERRALSPSGLLSASELRRAMSPEALLWSARAIPQLPAALRSRIWIAVEAAIAQGSSPWLIPSSQLVGEAQSSSTFTC
ncbi:RNA polymerase sigma factor [Chondromyces crocatus]|uniref:RNA polymerase subunit sigma n=1 Tax=Chondromyces crocatus TaxID=52 RepID=A0A0K1ERC3_CHOCO|nr:sigma-70 family RNA polymerase sigma factor [Chondromyces crocatus]AKT43197.1 uncharacterized protein CMC5_074280 [Chondromyces crocatus]